MSESRTYAPYAFSFNEEFFSSPNSSTFPASLPSPWSPLPDDPTPRQLRDRLWYSSGYPYLPYILKTPFHGDLLRRLSVSVERIEVIYDGSSWHLTKQTAKDWKALENVLDLAAKKMTSFFCRSSPKTALAFKPPKVPSKYGYFDTHESEPVARAAASASLDAFAVYLGYLSFLVAICQFGIRETHSPIPPWRKLLERQDSGVHPEWLKLLVASPIVDFTEERLGVVMHVSKCDWLHLASFLVKASVPVCFNWGKVPYYSTPSYPWISDYYSDLDNFTPVAPTNAGLYPPVNSGTGQRYSETMEQLEDTSPMKNEELPDTEAACIRTVSPLAGISPIDPPHFRPPPTLFFHGIRKDNSRQVNPLLADIYEIQPESSQYLILKK